MCVFRLLFLCLLLMSSTSYATILECFATKKLDSERTYPKSHMDKYKFSNKIEFTKDGVFISRCSYTFMAKKVTCDRYKVDHIEKDKNVNITKFYVFGPQFNMQLFSDYSYLEDNGRGGITYGICKLQNK